MNTNGAAKPKRKRRLSPVKLKNLKNKGIQMVEAFKRKSKMAGELEAMAAAHDERIRKMGEVFRFFTGSVSWDKRESELLDKIDSARIDVEKSREEIIIRDFGAGSTEEGRTEKQMADGVDIVKIVGEVCKGASTPRRWGELIFKIYREFGFGHCIELGTCLGFSGAYQAAALTLNGKGKLVTMEGAQSLAGIAGKNLVNMGFQNVEVVVGKFSDTMQGVLEDLKTVDFAFIDGHHDEDATITYFEQIWPYLSDEAVVIFDDINWSSGMKRAWKHIYSDKRVLTSVDLYKWGISLIDKNAEQVDPKRLHKMWIY
jgi:predicted O-methyltransferase YrrM